MIGEALGNYRVTAKIGSGTMGVVYRAEHVRIARTAAVKVLIPELAQNASAVQRFFTEARATSLIRHPGIVDVFDCDIDATGRAYIVMEYLDGETLADRLRRTERMPWTAACEIARQNMTSERVRLAGLRDHLETSVAQRIGPVFINGDRENRLPHVANLSFPDIDGSSLLNGLNDIAVSSGSACTSASPRTRPSRGWARR